MEMRTKVIRCWKTCLAAFLLIAFVQASRSVDWYLATNGAGWETNGWADATSSAGKATENI